MSPHLPLTPTNSATAHHTPRNFSKVTLAASLALSSLIITAPLAQAGPDDGKMIATRAHIDGPKTFWENNNFNLYVEAPRQGVTQNLDPSKTAIWVGKGYSGTDNPAQQYIFTVPDLQEASFLGKPGDNLYMTPSLPMGNHDPAWVGFGADTDIPSEKFRDGSFSLDMLDVKGPGQVEMFRFDETANNNSAFQRLLSSVDPGFHSTPLKPGTHTHNYTTFTKPGRYEITYRTVARAKDGSTIESKPTTVVWQVGGQSPQDGNGASNINDTANRFNAAPQGGDLVAAGYEFSLTPQQDGTKDGDDKLHSLTFQAKEKVNGKLTLFNNGYFLTDLDVKDGAARWDEMMGNEASQIQAVFTPDAESAPKWVSQPLAFTPGSSEKVTTSSAQGFGQWPQAIPDPDNTPLSTEQHTLSSADYSVEVGPSQYPGLNKVTFKFKDPDFRASISGGLFDNPKDPYPGYDIDSSVNRGEFTRYFATDEWDNGAQMRFDIIPHPDMNASRSQIVVTDSYDIAQTYRVEGKLSLGEGDAEPAPPVKPEQPEQPENPEQSEPVDSEPATEPTSSDEPVQPGESLPAEPAPSNDKPADHQCHAAPFAGKKILSDGHVDIKASLKNGKLGLALKDETGQLDRKATERNLNDVAFTVSDQAKFHRSDAMMDPALDFIGEAGSAFYGVPQTQIPGIIWPGYNTQDVDFSQLKGGVKLHIEPKTMPDQGHFGMYQQSGLGGIEPILDSQKGQDTIDVTYGTHVHANWVFTQPGNYIFNTYYTATLADGTEISSDQQDLSFAVGNQAVSDCTAATVEDDGEDKPNDAAPSADPAEPVAEETVAEEPATEEPDSAEPVAEESVNEGPADEGPANEEPVGGEPAAQNPVEGTETDHQDVVDQPSVEGEPVTSGSLDTGSALIPGPSGSTVVAPEGESAVAPQGSSGPVAPLVPDNSQSSDDKCYPVEEIVEKAQASAEKAKPVAAVVDATLSRAVRPQVTTVVNKSSRDQASEGHFDFGALLRGNQMKASVKDDRKSPAQWVSPESIEFVLGNSAKTKLPAGMDAIGKAGSEVYLIGATQQDGVPWLGWNTQDPELVKNVKGLVTMKLNSVDGPGKMSVFLSGNFGSAGQKVFDSESKGAFKVPLNTHQHGNWVFTQAGNYRVSVSFEAQLKNGKKVSTTSNLNFKVGDAATHQGKEGASAEGRSSEKSADKKASPEKQKDALGTVDQASGIVTRPDGTKVRVVGQTSNGEPCELSADQLAAAQRDSAAGKLAYTGLPVVKLASVAVLLLSAGAAALYVVRRRRNA